MAATANVGRLVLNHLIAAGDPGEADWIDVVRKTWDGALTIGRDGPVVAGGGRSAHGPEKLKTLRGDHAEIEPRNGRTA
jgi:hypothetical protein